MVQYSLLVAECFISNTVCTILKMNFRALSFCRENSLTSFDAFIKVFPLFQRKDLSVFRLIIIIILFFRSRCKKTIRHVAFNFYDMYRDYLK